MQAHFRRKLIESFSQEEVREMLGEIFSHTRQIQREVAPALDEMRRIIRLASSGLGKDAHVIEQQTKYLECAEVRKRAFEKIAEIMGSHAGINPPKTPFEWVEFIK